MRLALVPTVLVLAAGAALAQPDVTPVSKGDEGATDRVRATDTSRRKPAARPKAEVIGGQIVLEPVLEAQLRSWSAVSRRAVMLMIALHGEPTEYTGALVIWRDVAPWKEIIVHRAGVPHAFPTAHTDVVEHVIAYPVPADKLDELAGFDGSLIVRRTRGTLAASCDSEASNLLALNLAHQLITGAITVDDARATRARITADLTRGKKDPMTQQLGFELPTGATGDPDTAAPKVTQR